MFWRIDSNVHLSVIVPSSETFSLESFSRHNILATVYSKKEFHLRKTNRRLNVELRKFIESLFKCTIMIVKIIFKLGFSVKLKNLPDHRKEQPTWFFRFNESIYGFDPDQLHSPFFRPHKVPIRPNGIIDITTIGRAQLANTHASAK